MRAKSFIKTLLSKLPKKKSVQAIILIILIVLGTTIFVFRSATAATTVDSSTDTGPTFFSPQRKTFYDTSNNLFWAFYYNGSAIEYSNSSNGTSWTSRGTYTSISHRTFSVWYVEGTTDVYMVYLDTLVRAVKGTLGSTSISWGSAGTVDADATSEHVNISRSNTGIIWVSYYDANSTLRAIASTSADDVSAWGTSTEIGTHSGDRSTILIPLTSSGYMYAIYGYCNTAAGTSYQVRGRLYNGSWQSMVGIDTASSPVTCQTGRHHQHISAIADASDTIHLIYHDGLGTDTSTGAVAYRQYASGSWGTEVSLDTNTTNTSLTMSMNPSNGDLYAFWERGDDILYKKGVSPYTSTEWDTNATTLEGTGTNKYPSAGYKAGGSKVFLEYTEGTGSPYNVNFTYISLNAAPGQTSLSSPANAASVASTTPNLQMSATDADSDTLKYKVYVHDGTGNDGTNCTGSAISGSPWDQNSSGTGWDNGTTAYTSGATATFTVQTTLTRGNSYCWQAEAKDPTGSNTFGTKSSYRTFSVNQLPNAPTLSSPASGATNIPATSELRLYATDPDSDYLQYKLEFCTVNTWPCVNGSLVTVEQSAAQAGWSSKNASSGTAYTSGQTAIHLLQSALTANTTWYWRAYAKDPGGSNSYGSASSVSSFTTQAAVPNSINIGGGTTIYGGTTFGQ